MKINLIFCIKRVIWALILTLNACKIYIYIRLEKLLKIEKNYLFYVPTKLNFWSIEIRDFGWNFWTTIANWKRGKKYKKWKKHSIVKPLHSITFHSFRIYFKNGSVT